MAFKLQIVSGGIDAVAGTPTRCVSASSEASKCRRILFQCSTSAETIFIGDSTVDATAATAVGVQIPDLNDTPRWLILDASSDDFGLKGVQSKPYFDLYDIYVDSPTSGHRLCWTAWL